MEDYKRITRRNEVTLSFVLKSELQHMRSPKNGGPQHQRNSVILSGETNGFGVASFVKHHNLDTQIKKHNLRDESARTCTNKFSLKQGGSSFFCMAKLPFWYAATGVLGMIQKGLSLSYKILSLVRSSVETLFRNYSVSSIVVSQNV